MADKKISQMPAAGELTGDELVPLVQSGTNVTGTLDAVAGYTLSQATDFLTAEDLPDLSGYALAEDIPDVSNFITAEDLPDLSGYALAEDIPDVSNFVSSDVTGISGAGQITNMVYISQDNYDLIAEPDATTLYIIVE
jgi:hypothetical protein